MIVGTAMENEEVEIDLLDGDGEPLVDILPDIEKVPGWKDLQLGPKGKMAIRMLASGLRPSVVATILNSTPATISAYMASNEGQEYLKSLQVLLDAEFKLLQKKVINVTARALDSADIGTALKGAEFYAKYSGQFSQKIDVSISAEDLVKKLMEGSNATPALPEGNRKSISDTKQGRGDSSLQVEQCPGGHRFDPDI